MKLCDFMGCAFPKITEFPEMIRIIDYKNSIIEDFYGAHEGMYGSWVDDMDSYTMSNRLEKYYSYNICGMFQTANQELNIIVEE